MVTQSAVLAAQASRAGFSFPAARRRCPRRSSATCATRCLRKSSSPATCSAPRTRSRRATASAGSSRAMRCAPCRRSASPRSEWARAAARGWRAAIRGCSPRRWRCSSTSPASAPPRSWTRSAPSNASPPSWRPRTPPTRTSRGFAQIVADAEASLNDAARTTELGAAFHLAVAEASHNRVLVVQLISLQHVSWPRRNPTMTPKVARRILDVHKELLGADRNPRCRRRAQSHGRPRQDDPRPPGVGARAPRRKLEDRSTVC